MARKSLNVSLGGILICTHSSIVVIRAVFSVDVIIFAIILSASCVFEMSTAHKQMTLDVYI